MSWGIGFGRPQPQPPSAVGDAVPPASLLWRSVVSLADGTSCSRRPQAGMVLRERLERLAP
jgi:hypothetical protein